MRAFAKAQEVPGLIGYENWRPLIGTLVSGRHATLHELQTVYGIKDAYDLLELMTVDMVNEFRANEHAIQMAKLGA